MKYLVGTDPEIFIKNNDDTISSAIGIFKGTKEKPISIGNKCFVQEDNILVEFNIPPVDNKEEFIDYINYSKDYIETILAPLNKKLHYSSSEIASEEVLKDPNSKVFGCSSSFNVVTNCLSQIDIDSLPENIAKIRSSGFHIHIGYDNSTEEMNDRIVMCFELFVTLYLLKYDNDQYNRRALYGLIGDSRSKSYGVECRSLGGFFLKDDYLLGLVWDQIEKAMNFASESPLTNKELRTILLSCIKNNLIDNIKVQKVLNSLKKVESV